MAVLTQLLTLATTTALLLLTSGANAHPAAASSASDSTILVALSSSTDCTVLNSGPSQLVRTECTEITDGVQSFEFQEPPSDKIFKVFSGSQCDGQVATFSAEQLGCVNVGFEGASVLYI